MVYIDRSTKKPADDRLVHGFCQKHYAVGVPWDQVKAGTTAVRSCPRNALGMIFNPFGPNATFLNPMKTSETLMFPGG